MTPPYILTLNLEPQADDTGHDRMERAAATFAAAGTATFARAAGGNVLGVTGDGRCAPKVKIDNRGAFEGFHEMEYNAAYQGEAAIRCAMISQVCAAMAGSAAVELADPGFSIGLYETGTVGGSIDWEDALLFRFLPFAGVREGDEGIVRTELARLAREVVGRNWPAVSNTARGIFHLGGDNGYVMCRFPDLHYPCEVTTAVADALFSRVKERRDEWDNFGRGEEEAPQSAPTLSVPVNVGD